jgi:hypothetical protein
MTGDCPHCQGEGYLLCVGSPGYFSESFGNWLPSESYERCPRCSGSGLDVEITPQGFPSVTADREEELEELAS